MMHGFLPHFWFIRLRVVTLKTVFDLIDVRETKVHY